MKVVPGKQHSDKSLCDSDNSTRQTGTCVASSVGIGVGSLSVIISHLQRGVNTSPRACR